MDILLDTNILIMIARGTLTEKHRYYIENGDNALFYSPVSLWEIAIKNTTPRRSPFFVDIEVLERHLLADGYGELAIQSSHIQTFEKLPRLHKDPFDRLLIAQALRQDYHLLTSDQSFPSYPIRTLLVSLSPTD